MSTRQRVKPGFDRQNFSAFLFPPYFCPSTIRHHFRVPFQHLRGAGVVAFFPVHRGDLCHLLIGEGEIEQIQVVLNMGRVLGAGDHDVAALDMPAQDDLGVRFAVFFPPAP